MTASVIAHTVRTVSLWCRDWPVVAFDRPVGEAIAVLHANRVVAVSPSARVAGVAVGQRRREAQRRCPDVTVLERDVDREARVFERVMSELDDVTPLIELVHPGLCAFPVRGPARYFGGEAPMAATVRDAAAAAVPRGAELGVGIADGLFPSMLAAQRGATRAGSPPLIVAAGQSATFVAPMPIAVLDQPELGVRRAELIDVLVRLGIRRLADFAALDAGDVLGRFGCDGLAAHRLASGVDSHLADLTAPPADLDRSIELDPPAERVDQAAFAGKRVADELIEALAARGLSCVRIVVGVDTTGGACIERAWRHEGSLTATAVAQRIRWQVDGWLSRPGAVGRGGVWRVRLHPDQVVPASGRQHALWGGVDAAGERAQLGVARVQALLGAEAVRVPEWRGGRGPAEQYHLVPIDSADTSDRTMLTPGDEPWPGRVPAPHAAVVHRSPIPAEVMGSGDEPVRVSGRGDVDGTPVRLSIDRRPYVDITGWTGPWVSDERWWDPVAHRRRARFQVIVADGGAYLLAMEAGVWWVEATYD